MSARVCRALVAFTTLLIARSGTAQSPASNATHAPQSSLRAVRVARAPAIDGQLTDESWALAEPATRFTQQDPDEGQPATERTEVRVLYDDAALYVGVRLYDHDAAQISQRLSSRDADADADRVNIYLDPNHDHKTGVQFRVSASNIQKDTVLFNDTWDDQTWDAVWQSATSVDGEGWSAEIRIPLSQLRFPAAPQQTWGFNVARFIRRKNETSWLELTKKNESGLASRMAHLNGLDGIRPKRHLELLPYVAARTEFVAPTVAGNPFNDGSRAFGAVGLDAKYGLTSSLTLDGTVNPDFGQVEVDPAVVNLSAFETFFDEKRPFFLEGAQIFGNFGRDGANDYWNFNASDPTIFYSRRIGRAPQISATGDYIETPVATTILGAAKLSGKAGGWTLAALDAATADETAKVRTGPIGSRVTVEPLSNYFAARLQRPLGARAGAGLIATSVVRQLEAPLVAATLPFHATIVGGDGYYYLNGARDWVITGKLAASQVVGSESALLRVQRAAQRYYQRPDAPQVSLDPTRTSLAGYNGRVNLNRNSGAWRVNASLWGVSPGFEANDLGFMNTGDRAGSHIVFLWRGVQPNRFSRSRSFWVGKWYTWSFGRQRQSDGVQGNGNITLLNYLALNSGVSFRRETQDDRLTRGGPSAANPAGGNWYFNLNTDNRKPLSLQVNANTNWSESTSSNRNLNLQVSLKPSPRLMISTGPQLTKTHTVAQYVTQQQDPTATATLGGHYLFGLLDQTQLTLTTRVGVILTPRVSLQVYAQPLIAVGDYTDFKELAAPRTYDFTSYGTGTSTLTYDTATRRYTADADGTGESAPVSFQDPDFNLKSVRVNAVFRWEIKPGSTFYGVWTRIQQDQEFPGEFHPRRDLSRTFTAPGDDVFLVKLAYWIGR